MRDSTRAAHLYADDTGPYDLFSQVNERIVGEYAAIRHVPVRLVTPDGTLIQEPVTPDVDGISSSYMVSSNECR